MLGVIGKGLYENGNKLIVIEGRLVNLRPWGLKKVVEATKRSPKTEIDVLPATQEDFKKALELNLVKKENIGEMPIEIETAVKESLSKYLAEFPQYAGKYPEVSKVTNTEAKAKV
jgi:hypothetical protein